MRTEGRRTLVIFDEIHHGGDAKSWGDAILEAFGDATHRLALTGTPFRSDDAAIPFVRYEPDAGGLLRSQADHTYGYTDALADGVVRPVVFLAYSGETRWRDSAGAEYAARLGEPASAEHTARAWRTALDPAGEWMPAVVTAADTRLRQLRAGGVPDAGGMVIASDQQAARAYAVLLQRITGEEPTVVLSDDPGSSRRIAQFSAGTSRWLVAVRMVSEGVDVPRLAVGVYATSASTPLFFAQAIGRFVRSRRPGEIASVFLPSVPTLLLLASELEAQRNHVLGQPDRETDELAEAQRRQDEPSDIENKFESLGADAELDQVIFDGSSFGTATPAGSDEEADYLGIPGFWIPAQMRDLLRRQQEQQFDRTATARRPEPVTRHGQLRDLRRELNALVSAAHYRIGKPHGWIHNELRRLCGGPPVAAATSEQLAARIERCGADRLSEISPDAVGHPRRRLRCDRPRQVFRHVDQRIALDARGGGRHQGGDPGPALKWRLAHGPADDARRREAVAASFHAAGPHHQPAVVDPVPERARPGRPPAVRTTP